MVKKNEFTDPTDYGAVKRIYKASELIERQLDGSDYERGQLETIEAASEKTAKALARLVEILYRRKLISRKNVYEVVDLNVPFAEQGKE